MNQINADEFLEKVTSTGQPVQAFTLWHLLLVLFGTQFTAVFVCYAIDSVYNPSPFFKTNLFSISTSVIGFTFYSYFGSQRGWPSLAG